MFAAHMQVHYVTEACRATSPFYLLRMLLAEAPMPAQLYVKHSRRWRIHHAQSAPWQLFHELHTSGACLCLLCCKCALIARVLTDASSQRLDVTPYMPYRNRSVGLRRRHKPHSQRCIRFAQVRRRSPEQL